MASVTIDPIVGQIKTRERIISGTASGQGTVSVDLSPLGFGVYDTFDCVTEIDGSWRVEVTFQDLYDGQTIIQANFLDTNDDYASDSIQVDYLAPCFENDFLLVCPNPRIPLMFSTAVTITAKTPTDIIYAGSGEVPKYTTSGEGSVVILLASSSYIFVTLLGVGAWDFRYTIQQSRENQDSSIEILQLYGVQFRNLSKYKFTREPVITENLYKIDSNKYFRFI
jgi:hypothetical protein